MAKFLFVYHGDGRPENPEDVEATMAAWGKWMQDHGAALIEPGNPVGASKTVTAEGVRDGGGANPVSGYTLVEAEDFDTACAIAAENPMVMDGSGSVEVAEIVQM